MKYLALIFLLLVYFTNVPAATEGTLSPGFVNPGYHEKPAWFKHSFLDLGDDLNEANLNNKKLILYFYQDGCPYCEKLLEHNFRQQEIVLKMQQYFDLVDLNMWGDRIVTLTDDREVTEKDLARELKVMFTPTLIVLDNEAKPLFRINGYYSSDKFNAVLDYLTSDAVNNTGFLEYYQSLQNSQSADRLYKEKFIYQGNNLKERLDSSAKPLLILFEQINCRQCDELHGDVFRRLAVYKKLRQFNIAQININSDQQIISPQGQSMSQSDFAKQLAIQYTPTMIFYDKAAPLPEQPVFRSEAYLKSFHTEALFDYILTKAYLAEPEFQRFVQRRADRQREQGIEVDLWD